MDKACLECYEELQKENSFLKSVLLSCLLDLVSFQQQKLEEYEEQLDEIFGDE